jgi:hypothetical protein
MTTQLDVVRRDFWAYAIDRDPELKTYMDSNAWCPAIPDGRVIIAFGIEQVGSSVFLRGQLYSDHDTAGPVLRPHAAILSKLLSAPFETDGDVGQGRYFRKRNKSAFTLKSQWPEIARWFSACRLRYQTVLAEVTGGDHA